MDIWEQLEQLGLELPPVPSPVANYVPAKMVNGIIYVSGQLPFKDGTLLLKGKVTESQLDEARQAAAQCFLNAMAAASTVVPIETIKSVIRIGGFVFCDEEFREHSAVINGASSLAVALFGEGGRHARCAIGCSSLPLGSSVEVEVIFGV